MVNSLTGGRILQRNLPACVTILRGVNNGGMSNLWDHPRRARIPTRASKRRIPYELCARWKQRNDPNEPAPGLPLTHEARVHFALLLYHNDSSMDPTVMAINRAAREAGVGYKDVVKALDHTNRTNESKPGLPLTNEDRVRSALLKLKQNDSSKKPGNAALVRAAREARVDPDLVVEALNHADRA